MSAGQADTVEWWFGYRVKGSTGGTPGNWVPEGPYSSDEQAKTERMKAKNRGSDGEVTPHFTASTRAEAQQKCDTGRVY